jgi:hypothetical protein
LGRQVRELGLGRRGVHLVLAELASLLHVQAMLIERLAKPKARGHAIKFE